MALFLILATFATLMMLTTVKISLAASAVVAFGLVARDMVAGHSIKMLTTGALVVFASLAGYHLMAASEMSPTSVRLAVNGSILAIALGSIAIRLPFTLQYAREVVDAETVKQPHFLRTNYVLSWVWSAAFVLMVLADIVSIYLPDTQLWVWAAVAFAARNSATYFTQWYPKHVLAGIAASTTTAAA
jgi:hypothetical protein